MIPQYTATLRDKILVCEDTYQFTFSKPEGFTFHPGQYAFLDFSEPQFTDDRPSMRAMSIASAPDEENLIFIMRTSDSAFKRNITSMETSDEIIIKGPLGHVALPENAQQPLTFIIAGVGVTPARSMIAHITLTNTPRPVTVIYSNRDDRNIALQEWLDDVQLPQYKAVYTLTRQDEWVGEKGRIDAAMIKRNVDDLADQMYYVVGNATFIDSMKSVLEDLGVAKDHVQYDNFG